MMDRPNFPQWTILAFVEQLAEGTPLPGGGCAVSVAGALAAALGSLSGQISRRRAANSDQQAALAAVQPQIEQARQTFLDLIDADALAYHEVVLARRLPRATPAEQQQRDLAIIQAFARACGPPLDMARLGLEVLGWATLLADSGSPVILADVGVMGFLALAVVQGGLVNVFANLTMMAGAPEADALHREAAALKTRAEAHSRDFAALLYRRLAPQST
ncbi:MAG: cyclodeaminase/cyclohydrolase family protein [Desulfobacca sp.]|uniref:cyclodeaminase/cyclohydrolase family protein n=1 Tax=Desulfobacca sp. TaxID=2067990 RepID=UPI00404B7C13